MNKQSIEHLTGKIQNGEVLKPSEQEKLLEIIELHKSSLDYNDIVQDLSEIGLLQMQGDRWKKGLKSCFERLSKGIGAHSIRFYEFKFQAETGEPGLAPYVEWNSGHNDQKSVSYRSFSFLSKRKYRFLFKKFEANKPFQSRLDEQANGPLKMLMQSENCKSTLILPVKSRDTLYGIIRFDDCLNSKEWTQDELARLEPIVFQFRNIFERRDMEKQLQNTYRQAKIGTWEMDLETGSYSWSPITKEIFEVSEDHVPDEKMAMDIFFDQNSREKLMRAVDRAQITGDPYDMELRIKTLNGNIKWVRDTGRAEFKNGKCVKLYGIVQDIDQRKLAEQESEKNKRLLEAITQQTEVAVWVRDDSGNILFVNNQWKSIFGFGGEEVIGKSLHDLFNGEGADEMITSDRSVVQRNEQVIFEEFLDTAIGPRHYMVNKFPLRGISGLENAVGGIGTDITEIKETETRLQETKQKLREIIEHSTNLFYTHDVNHNLTYLSPQSIDFLGYLPEEAKRRWTEFATDHPDNEKGFAHTQRAIESGEPQPPFELELIRGDGVKIWVEVNEAPVVKDGKTVSIAGSLTDITKRKIAQNKIRESLREKETLLAEIHHRVKNNLAVVASLMQLQAMESENPDVQGELLESVLRIKSMAGIHEHLYKTEDFANLDFAHNLKMLVSEVTGTMQFSADISLSFDCEEVRLSVNQAIPCSLIINEVITNIIKHGFTGRDKGIINTHLKQESDVVTITIKDNGVGLPENFDPESTKTLGMQLIKTLSQQLFGSYKFDSNKNGATFRLTFSKKAGQAPVL